MVLVVSMVPLIELRGAIPVAIGLDLGLPEWAVLVTAIVGNIIPVPLIYIFARRFLEWGSGRKAKGVKRGGMEEEKKLENEKVGKGKKLGRKGTEKEEKLARFCNFCLTKGEKAGKKLVKKAGNSIYFALFLFVAIPLPGTGAWTGTLAASLLNLDYKKTVVAICMGILVAGAIMLGVSVGVVSIFTSG